MRSRSAPQVQAPQLSGRFAPFFSPLAVLQACHLAELTGTLRARAGVSLVTVGFEAGEIVTADALDADGMDALIAFQAWTYGSFDFHVEPPPAGTAVPGPFNWLLLEICRRADEARVSPAVTEARPAAP